MSTSDEAFQSIKRHFEQQSEQIKRVFGALESLDPSQPIRPDGDLLQAFDAACEIRSLATAPARMPMGIRA